MVKNPSISTRTRRLPAMITLAAMALAGCQSTTQSNHRVLVEHVYTASPPPNSNATGERQYDSIPGSGGGKVSADEVVGTDSCGLQMERIENALLEYMLVNKSLPAKLEDLQTVQDVDEPLMLTCPISKRPYVYNPEGLIRRGQDKRVIIYDPEPSHNGKRWCILMAPTHGPSSVSTELLELPEVAFKEYKPAPQ